MKRVGFIGVGIMGSSMVRNLMKDGYEVHIYARNKEKVEQVIADGAVFHDTIAECVKGRDAVITIVGYPQDVEDVYLGEDKILESADPGTYLIDMTTTSPSLDAQLAKEAAEKGLKMLDAPVTGGDYGARSGTLSILVGGAKETTKPVSTCSPPWAKTSPGMARPAAGSMPSWLIKSCRPVSCPAYVKPCPT